jgi:hypothetical protein
MFCNVNWQQDDCFSRRLQAMVMTQPWWLLSKENPQMSKRLLRVKLKLRAHKMMLKRMQMLEKLRCEGVELNASEHMFCTDILAYLRLRTFREMERIFL